ncbi:winged helix-turn-helix domain-containing protein [Sphingomonas sp. JC676]|uniref:ATP-binding protein n=1 Tax=Sphingomonas sp. JC676 TaxID=2768065 RepID=UPI001658574E|nr:winged helix-turn-helix domain-containing protein [Sphingomonas sp. JC676]MBC9032652.1 winged helix-turn-helix domain-containing protein [Sphingomonas sp. JC676]
MFGPFELNIVERTLKKADEVIPLGSRAFDILVTLVDQPGEIVGKNALIDRVWPDVTVEEGSLRVHLSALRKALGEGQFGSKYIANVPGRGYSFVTPVVRQEAEGDKVNPVARISSLPIASGGMIGRDEVVHQIRTRLRTERLITIVGTGGIGKTTVALAVGRALLEDFSGAVLFLDLSVFRTRDQVVTAIASMIGLVALPGRLEEALLEFLRSRRALLILDSCEHLVEQVAEIADRIFRCAPDVCVLATSREALQTAGEHVFRLQPLGFPPEQSGQTVEEILSYPAARLFLEQVNAQGVDLVLGADEAVSIAEICRRLDGIPLAIELAARAAAVFGVHETARRLFSRLDLLERGRRAANPLKLGRRTANPRHQTLRATLDWSHEMLSEVERAVLRRVAIFSGGFSLEAALVVAEYEVTDGSDIACSVVSLVEKSLIASRMDHQGVSYRLLDTTRSYALEKLIASGEHEAIATRHAIYSAQWLEANKVDFFVGIRKDTQLEKDYLGNTRAALEWSFGPGGSDALAIRLAAAAGPVFLAMPLMSECRNWMERAIEQMTPDCDPQHQMEVHASLALSLMFTETNSELVRDAFNVALTFAQQHEDANQELRLLSGLTLYFQQVVDVPGMRDVALRAEAIASKTGKPEHAAVADCMLGPAYYLLGDQRRAQRHVEQALGVHPGVRRLNASQYMFDPVLTRSSLYGVLFRSLWLTGNLDRAVDYANTAIEEAERSDHPIALFRVHALAASLYFWIDDLPQVERNLVKIELNAEKNSLGLYRAIAVALRGMYFLRTDRIVEGMEHLRDALKRLAMQRYKILVPYFAAELAVCLAKQNDRAEALALLDEAISGQREVRMLIHLPGLFLAKALAFTYGDAPDRQSAEEYFKQSMALAREQSALSYELRAGLELAQIWIREGRVQRARDLIAPIYSRFSEGFETPDLVLAREMLDGTVTRAGKM